MLSSTGCFRSVICPFSARGSCQRHYCHFKHAGKTAETMPRPQGPVYMSSDTDVPTALADKTLEKQCDQSVLPEAACTVLELEKVSKAIEVVKTEVEQQQHKLLMYKSTLEGENHNSLTPSTSSRFSCVPSSTSNVNILASKTADATTIFECEVQNTCLNSVTCNSTPIASPSLSQHRFNALTEVTEEDTFQSIPMASSKIKNACSVLNKYVIDRCRPCTDLEYDPLVNYSSNLKQTVKKGSMEEKQEFKMIEHSPEKRFSLATLTARSSQSCETLSSGDDELVIDVPELPPLTQNPQVHRRCQRKGNDANTSNLSLIRKVRQLRAADSSSPVLDGGKSVDDSASRNFMPENSSREKELILSTLQGGKKSDSNESCKFSNVTNSQMSNINKHLDVPKPGSKARGLEGPLKLGLVKKENSVVHVDMDRVKSSNQKCRIVYVPEKLEVDVQKCEKMKERSLIHLDSLKKVNEKVPQAESKNASLKVDQVPSSAIKCNKPGTENNSKYISKLETRLSTDQRPKIQNQANNFGNKNRAESQQTTSDKDEESSLSDEELSSIPSEGLDFSESDPMEECLRIFNESSKQEIKDSETDIEQSTAAKTYENIQDFGNSESANAGQKKRIAHVAKFKKGRSSCSRVIIPHTLPPSKQPCHSRIKLVQQQAVQLMANVKSARAYKATVSNCPGQKRLIVQGTEPQPVSAAKAASHNSFRKVPSASSSSSSNVPSKEGIVSSSPLKTTCTVSPLGSASCAPAPQRTNSKRGSKVSKNVRKQYLGFFIEEFLKTCSSRQEAIKKALSEEKVIFERSTSRFMYLNVAVQALKILRNPINQGPVASDGAALYRVLKDYVLTEEQLKENGYPRYNPDKPGTALLLNSEAKKYIADSLIRVCCRCGKSFSVTLEGNYISKEECGHHWGRIIRRQVPGGWDARYSCCGGSLGSVGCQVAKLHVYIRKENLDGFVKTFLKLLPLDGNPGVYAVNSEMCFTKQGGELSHVSVINANLEVVYDVFVKPENEVIDYNTRFSGVTREDLMNTKTTTSDVQSALLGMLSADTILIGHSLDKDLLALKLIHSMVIDTSVVFPHSLGLPHKRALKSLMADYLNHSVPDNVEGSDKGRACMELMMWRVKRDAKGRKW
ncbi:uncharacterized protein LOC144689728 [Cetorhinus maximus]